MVGGSGSRVGRAAWALVLALAFAAHADPVERADHLAADPDTAAIGLSLRDYMGATVGAAVPVVGDDGPGWSVQIPMLVELHNRIGNLAPNNYWRGLIGVDVHLRLKLPGLDEGPARFTLRLTHESDHVTWGVASPKGDFALGFYDFNSLGLAGAFPLSLFGQEWVASTEARIHLVTCNESLSLCGSGALGWGSPGAEWRGELTWLGPAGKPAGSWRPTASLFLDWLAPHALIRTERRLVAHAGAYLQTERRGTFQVYLLGWLGNDVGFARQQRIAQTGIGVRWSPP